MAYIKLGYGIGIKATLLTPAGAVCDLRDALYVNAVLTLPNGSTMYAQDIAVDRVTNAIYVRLLADRELTAEGNYRILFNVKLADGVMYSTVAVNFANVTTDADAEYKELSLSFSLEVTDYPQNVERTGASPKVSSRQTWLVYNDEAKAYEDTGIPAEVNLGDYYTKEEADGKFAHIIADVDNKIDKTSAENYFKQVDNAIKEQKNEMAEFKEAVTDQVENYKPIVINGDVSNAADEEDITSENGLLKLANRSAINGMGYVILRKDKTFAEQVTLANTIYEIRYDFDLNGKEITIPKNCVLQFEGGSLSWGILSGDNIGKFTIINGVLNELKCSVSHSDEIKYTNCKSVASQFYTTYCKSVTFDNCIFIENYGFTECIYCIDTKSNIYNCTISDCGGDANNNVRAVILQGDCSYSTIKNCAIDNIIANTNASGIEFTIKDNKISRNFLIEDCTISNINGIIDDGDGIKVIAGSNGEVYGSINSSIVNCYFKNCTKRAIKLQTIGVVCRDIYVDNLCAYAVIDYQMGNAHIENLKANNIDSYNAISVAKIVENIYINNCNFQYIESVDREANIIRIISASGANYGNNVTITNIKSNRASYSLNHPNIIFQGNSDIYGNFQNIKIENIEVETAGISCIVFQYMNIKNLLCNNILYNGDNYVLSIPYSTVENANIIINAFSEFIRTPGISTCLGAGLYSATPLSKITIFNERAYIQNPTNDPASVTSTWLKVRLKVGDILLLPTGDKRWDGTQWVDLINATG